MSNATKPTNPKDEANQPSSGHRKTASPATRTAELTPQKCPRCDSPNTKFCYYNNYSLTQPRHFCKTCRRYWTKGGALRNVPVGGGCRKNKKLRSNCKDMTSSSGTSITSDHHGHHHLLGGVGSTSGFMNLKLFHGISPAMDFNLGALQPNNNNNNTNNSSTLLGGFDYHNPNHNHSLSLASGSTSSTQTGILFNNNNPNNTLASSIESLSSINQDLHWKLQQQRLSMLLGPNNNHGGGVIYGHNTTNNKSHHQTVPILFQNLEISKEARKEDDHDHDHDHDHVVIGSDQTVVGSGGNMDQWFFGLNSYNNNGHQVQLPHQHVVNNTAQTNGSSNGNELNVTSATTSNWINNVNGANWSTTSQFSAALP